MPRGRSSVVFLLVLALGCGPERPAEDKAGDTAVDTEAEDSSRSETGADDTATPVDADVDGIPAEEDCDDADFQVGGATPWYRDADADGYGDASGAVTACDRPDGHVVDATDCDDGDPTIHPGGVEVCRDGLDNDCDGSLGVCAPEDTPLTDADARYWGAAPGEEAGGSVALVGDVDADGYADMATVALAIGESRSRLGKVHLVRGGPAPSSHGLELADATYLNTADSGLHYLTIVAAAGDVDADGYADMLLGGDDFLVALVRGGPAPTSILLADVDPAWAITTHDDLGASLAGAGDIDGDGFADVIVGAPSSLGPTGDRPGAAHVLLGAATPPSGMITTVGVTLWGEHDSDWAGVAVAGAGDVDGDGLADVLVGAHGSDATSTYSGAAYLVLGSATFAGRGLDTADARYTGKGERDQAGAAVAGVGDVDADGYADLLVGSHASEDGGTGSSGAWLVRGGATPAGGSLADADAQYAGVAGDRAGVSLAGAGDVNGDGHADLLVGASLSGTTGAAYLVLGTPAPASRSLGDADARYAGIAFEDGAAEVGGGGDVNGDGYDDMLVGAPGNDDIATDAGALYLLFGTGP